ncbi:MAG: SRPBCC domain-containing protein [Candidatus Hydrogenedentes bacterium]|nr:SRPBCC domain-containing protein [Candidatus Hydrogenedentota bacterium]
MNTCETSFVIEKEIQIAASAERIFAALSEPAQRTQWWGVKGKFEVTHMESDLRTGGAWRMSGVSMGEVPFTIQGTYQSIEPPRVLEFTWRKDEETMDTLVRFELEEKGFGTVVRLTHSGFNDAHTRDLYQGWPWLLSMLQGHVEGQSSKASC